jgi:hypothetical protein
VQAMTITIRTVGVEQASEVRRIMQLAFEEYRVRLVPPSGALTETIDDVRTAINSGGAFLAFAGDVAVGSARYRLFPDHAYAERVAVLPTHRGQGRRGYRLTHQRPQQWLPYPLGSCRYPQNVLNYPCHCFCSIASFHQVHRLHQVDYEVSTVILYDFQMMQRDCLGGFLGLHQVHRLHWHF